MCTIYCYFVVFDVFQVLLDSTTVLAWFILFCSLMDVLVFLFSLKYFFEHSLCSWLSGQLFLLPSITIASFSGYSILGGLLSFEITSFKTLLALKVLFGFVLFCFRNLLLFGWACLSMWLCVSVFLVSTYFP